MLKNLREAGRYVALTALGAAALVVPQKAMALDSDADVATPYAVTDKGPGRLAVDTNHAHYEIKNDCGQCRVDIKETVKLGPDAGEIKQTVIVLDQASGNPLAVITTPAAQVILPENLNREALCPNGQSASAAKIAEALKGCSYHY